MISVLRQLDIEVAAQRDVLTLRLVTSIAMQ